MTDIDLLKKIANQLRILSIRSTTIAGSGHPTSCASAAELVAALFFGHMRFDPTHPRAENNDRFILSKGHAAPILYAAWAETGHFPVSELDTLRKLSSPFEGHPTPRLDFVDVATGSLGQGLSAGAGMAINARIDHLDYNTYVLLGDGEISEGSVWEAASLAGVRKLNNLAAIVDVNRLGQSQETAFGHRVEVYKKRFDSFGWAALVIDGHDMGQILGALSQIGKNSRPLAIIAKTIKGKGMPGIEDQPDWHGKPLPPDRAREIIDALTPQSVSAIGRVEIPRPGPSPSRPVSTSEVKSAPIRYSAGQGVATRKAFGHALARIGRTRPLVVVLDGDVENSTYTQEFAGKFPDRFIECYISEQNMLGASVGLSASGKIPFSSTFAAFFGRAMDQVRMASISMANIKMVGTHAGVSIGEDGPSQMGLEDLAAMRAVHGSVVLSPCDAVSTEKLVEKMADLKGLCYMRTARPATPVIYSNEESFEIGGAKILRQSPRDRLTIAATGVTVPEALKAHDQLAKDGIAVTIIDVYSIKPLARDLIRLAMNRTERLILTVEDHYPEGGLGDAIAGELSEDGARVRKLAVRELPHSGTKEELMAKYRIDANAIVDEARRLISPTARPSAAA